MRVNVNPPPPPWVGGVGEEHIEIQKGASKPWEFMQKRESHKPKKPKQRPGGRANTGNSCKNSNLGNLGNLRKLKKVEQTVSFHAKNGNQWQKIRKKGRNPGGVQGQDLVRT